jgi:hypothetical protein
MKYRTRVVEVEAFRWTGEPSQDCPEWVSKKARLFYPTTGSVRLTVDYPGGGVGFDLLQGEWLLRFPDGHIEKRTPEEFKAQFEPVPRPGCGSCGNDVTQVPDGADPNDPNPCTPCEDGSAWVPRRSTRVLEALKAVWERFPNLSLTQLMEDVMKLINPHCFDDDEMVRRLREYEVHLGQDEDGEVS